MIQEVWKQLEKFPRYEISNKGVVRDRSTKGVIGLYYPIIELRDSKGARKFVKLHKLVADTFIPNPENKEFVNHKDGDKTNYAIDNLEWVTAQENNSHAKQIGLNYLSSFSGKAVIGKHRITGELKRWDSTRSASGELGYSSTSVSSACLGKTQRVGNWFFVFEENYNESSFDNKVFYPIYNKKAVIQLDKITKEPIAEFESAREAERVTGAIFSKICLACSGKRKTAGGFSWKYKD